jgi:mRNA interferase MazF
MENEYQKWHILKNNINNKIINFFPKEREVWVTYIGKNIGYEQNGSGDNYVRPCLILKRFNNKMFWVIPLSSKQKELDFYLNFRDRDNKTVSLIISQLKLISVNRLDRKMYKLNLDVFKSLKEKIRNLLI